MSTFSWTGRIFLGKGQSSTCTHIVRIHNATEHYVSWHPNSSGCINVHYTALRPLSTFCSSSYFSTGTESLHSLIITTRWYGCYCCVLLLLCVAVLLMCSCAVTRGSCLVYRPQCCW